MLVIILTFYNVHFYTVLKGDIPYLSVFCVLAKLWRWHLNWHLTVKKSQPRLDVSFTYLFRQGQGAVSSMRKPLGSNYVCFFIKTDRIGYWHGLKVSCVLESSRPLGSDQLIIMGGIGFCKSIILYFRNKNCLRYNFYSQYAYGVLQFCFLPAFIMETGRSRHHTCILSQCISKGLHVIRSIP